MKQNTKEWIQYGSAIALIASSIARANVSFLITKDIGAGPLTYIGEALSTALGIFGIGVYFAGKVTEFKKEIRNFLVEEQNKQPDDNSTD